MGRRTAMTRENLQTDSYRYDPTGQLVAVDYSPVGASLATPSSGNNGNPNSNNGKGNSSSTGILPVSPRIETFSYDPLGNRIEHTDTGDGTSLSPLFEQYETNALNQYTQITRQVETPTGDDTQPPETQDENADDTQTAPSNPSANLSPNLTLTYDSNGNLTDDGTQLYKYDAQNRLVEVEAPTVKAEFAYDALNRCILRQYYMFDSNGTLIPDESNSVVMTYDTEWNILSDCALSGRQIAEYVHGNRVDEVLVQIRDSDSVYPLSDAINSTIMLTGQNGNSLGVCRYDAFGKPSGEDAGYRYLYTGREWLQTVGLNDNRNRYYQPQTGRWLSSDPIGFEGGLNIYAYVENNPTSYYDPLGLASDTLQHDSFNRSFSGVTVKGILYWKDCICDQQHSRKANAGKLKRRYTLDANVSYENKIPLTEKLGTVGAALAAVKKYTGQNIAEFGIAIKGTANLHVNYDECVETGTGGTTLTISAGPYGSSDIGAAVTGYYFKADVNTNGAVDVTFAFDNKSIVASVSGAITYSASYSYQLGKKTLVKSGTFFNGSFSPISIDNVTIYTF